MLYNRKLLRILEQMVDKIGDLNTAVDALTQEVNNAVAALNAAKAADDTDAIEAAVARLNAAKAALAAADGSAPATGV